MDYHTHSDNPTQALKGFFIIGPVGLILLNALATIILLMLNSRVIWSLVHGNGATTTDSLQTIFSQRFSPLARIFNSTLFDRLGLLLFWALIGCTAYMVIWLIQYTLTTAREDFVEGHYVHPRSYSSNTYWRTVAAHRIFLLSTAIVSSGYMFFMVRAGLPVLSKLFYIGVYSVLSISGLFSIIISVALTALCLYIGYLLLKLLRGTWGLVNAPS